MNEIERTPARIDRNLVAQLADTLAQGRTDGLAALFRAHDARTPTLVWRPGLMDLQHPVLRSFLRGCGGAPEGTMPLSWVETEAFSVLSDWCMVLEAVPDGSDYIYRHYGPEIARTYGNDMTGRRVADIGGHVSTFFLALYHAVARRRETVKSVHEPPRQVFVRAWRRVILPLHDSAGAITRFAVVNIPDNELRAGLDVLPDAVMVVSESGGMCYANRAACLMFGKGRGPTVGAPLETFTGIALALPDSPDQLILEGAQRRHQVPHLHNGNVTILDVTVGGTYYRETPLFIVSARKAR